eukprot:Gb_38963 [translate_table: standard]
MHIPRHLSAASASCDMDPKTTVVTTSITKCEHTTTYYLYNTSLHNIIEMPRRVLFTLVLDDTKIRTQTSANGAVADRHLLSMIQSQILMLPPLAFARMFIDQFLVVPIAILKHYLGIFIVAGNVLVPDSPIEEGLTNDDALSPMIGIMDIFSSMEQGPNSAGDLLLLLPYVNDLPLSIPRHRTEQSEGFNI